MAMGGKSSKGGGSINLPPPPDFGPAPEFGATPEELIAQQAQSSILNTSGPFGSSTITGGGDDPYDRDETLAILFKGAVLRQQENSCVTDNPYGIKDYAAEIIQRTEQSGHMILLLAPPLRPIAKKIFEIEHPSDRESGYFLAGYFEGFDCEI